METANGLDRTFDHDSEDRFADQNDRGIGVTTSWTFVYENSAFWVGEGQLLMSARAKAPIWEAGLSKFRFKIPRLDHEPGYQRADCT